MNNRNFPPAPFPTITPQLLAQMAAAAFRPPSPMGAPQPVALPHVMGFGLLNGLNLLNAGIDKLEDKSKQAMSLVDFFTGKPMGGFGG